MAYGATQAIAESELATHRLTVLVALGDAARAERPADLLAASDDLSPVMAGAGRMADVAVIDDAALESHAVDPAIPGVLLSRRAGHQQAASGLAVLPASADDLLVAAAVRLVAAGYRVTREAGSAEALDDFHGDAAEEASDEASARPVLSPREAEVLTLLAEGAPNKVIARRLNISVPTAKFHVAAILVKLGAANRTDAIATAMRQGLVLV